MDASGSPSGPKRRFKQSGAAIKPMFTPSSGETNCHFGTPSRARIVTKRKDSPDVYLGGNMHQYLIKRSKTVLENENTDLRLSHGKARRCQSERNIEPVRQPVQQRSSHYHKSGGHINISPGFESSIHKSFPVESGIDVARRDDFSLTLRGTLRPDTIQTLDDSKPMSQHNSVELLDSIEKKLFGGEKNELQLKTVSVGVFSKVYRLNFKGSDVAVKMDESRTGNGSTERLVDWRLVGTFKDSPGARLKREAEVLKRLQHPNIISLKAVGSTEDGGRFIVTELLPKGMLSSKPQPVKATMCRWWVCSNSSKPTHTIKRKMGRMDPINAAEKVVELAQALQYLHERAIYRMMVVHGNICPDNIGIAENGRLKIIDFSSCDVRPINEDAVQLEMGDKKGSDFSIKRFFSRSRCFPFSCGALRYMAPEVACGQQSISPASDIYSLGLLLWSLISGVDPYAGINRSSFYSSIVRNEERPCCKTSWPEPIMDIVRLCWSTDPECRPGASAVEVALSNTILKQKSM